MRISIIASCLLFAFTFQSFKLQASHYSAGEMFYEWIGDEPNKGINDYRIYVTIFRNIGGVTIGTGSLAGCFFDTSASNSISITYFYVSPQIPLPAAYQGWWVDSGPHPNDNLGWDVDRPSCTSNNYEVSEYRYVAEVTLPHQSAFWRFAIDPPCCRDASDNLITNDDFYLRVKLDNTLGPNSSPRITSPAIGDFCVADTSTAPVVVWSQLATEEDGDSLYIDFASVGALSGNCGSGPSLIPYDSGLAVNKPLPVYGNIIVDHKRGVFRFLPKQQGKYVVKIEVRNFRFDSATSQYRNIGNTMREMVFQVSPACLPEISKAPEVCMVGFDPGSKKIKLVFEDTFFELSDSIFLFRGNRDLTLVRREMGGRFFIDSVTDGINFPPEKYSAYSLNRCGVYTDTGDIHQNMYLQATKNGSGAIDFNWTPYVGKSVNQYRLYSADSSYSNLNVIAQVPGNSNSYTASNLPQTSNYFLIEAVLDSADCLPANYGFQGPLAAAILGGLGVNEPSMRNVEVFPNPATDKLRVAIGIDKNAYFTLSNTNGQIVLNGELSGAETEIEVGELPTGVYLFQIDGWAGAKLIQVK